MHQEGPSNGCAARRLVSRATTSGEWSPWPGDDDAFGDERTGSGAVNSVIAFDLGFKNSGAASSLEAVIDSASQYPELEIVAALWDCLG